MRGFPENLCHGVRTPLTTIANSANLLLYRLEQLAPTAGSASFDAPKARATMTEMQALVGTILVEVRLADRRVLDAAWVLASEDPHVEVLLRLDAVGA